MEADRRASFFSSESATTPRKLENWSAISGDGTTARETRGNSNRFNEIERCCRCCARRILVKSQDENGFSIEYSRDLYSKDWIKYDGKFVGKFVEITTGTFPPRDALFCSISFFRDTNKRDMSPWIYNSVRVSVVLIGRTTKITSCSGSREAEIRSSVAYIDNPRHEFAGILVQHYNAELTRN